MPAQLIEETTTLLKLLLDGVQEAIGRSKRFASLLEDLRFTLVSLRPQILRKIGEHDMEICLPYDLQRRMEEGVKLVAKLPSLGIWDYYCMKRQSYSDKLADLYRSLRRELYLLKLKEKRDTNELLLVARKIHDRQTVLDGRLTSLLNQPPQEAIKGYDDNREANQHQDKGGGGGGGAGRDLEHVLSRLLEVLDSQVDDVHVNGKRRVIKPVLVDLKSTVSSFQPLMVEISEYNKVLELPKVELENLRKQLQRGTELVDKCSKLPQEAGYKRFEYLDQLLELDEYLRRLLCMMRMRVTKDMKATLDSVCNMELMCTRIEELSLSQIQTDQLAAL